MNKIALRNDVLDKIKAEHEIETDSELAETIGISKPLLSQIRNGIRGVSTIFIAGMLINLQVPFDLTDDGLYEVAA